MSRPDRGQGSLFSLHEGFCHRSWLNRLSLYIPGLRTKVDGVWKFKCLPLMFVARGLKVNFTRWMEADYEIRSSDSSQKYICIYKFDLRHLMVSFTGQKPPLHIETEVSKVHVWYKKRGCVVAWAWLGHRHLINKWIFSSCVLPIVV